MTIFAAVMLTIWSTLAGLLTYDLATGKESPKRLNPFAVEATSGTVVAQEKP